MRPVPYMLLMALATCLLIAAPVRPIAAAPPTPSSLQQAFAEAARAYSVPEPLLLAIAYNLSRWEHHAGAPSVAGGYGIMHLLDTAPPPVYAGRGDGLRRRARPDPGPVTVAAAARLTGLAPAALRADPAANLRGGAALLAQFARETTGALPATPNDWYGAVARYSGSSDETIALDFAENVFATLRSGAARTTADGQWVVLAAQPEAAPNRATARSLLLRRPPPTRPDCPAGLECVFVAAGYATNVPGSSDDYGNYDFADRPANGLPLRYIIIHNTEISYDLTLRVFQHTGNYVSTHYVVRSSDGQVAHMVRGNNVAWHAGNWFFNGQSLGIEHEGIAIEGAAWYTEPMYRASARLTRHLAERYGVPLDRAHIIGHDEIPGPIPSLQAGMHWDPGPFWDWAHYMELLGAPFEAPDAGRPGSIVVINPDFAANQPAVTYCYDAEAADCRDVPRQGANFVLLRTAPAHDAPFVTNPYLSTDPTRANNWSNKAVAGQQFYRAERRGEWDGIYFGGQLAWFYNPGFAATSGAQGLLVTPKPGLDRIPVYGRAYPEASAYPSGVTPQALVPIYELPAGQFYVALDAMPGSYFHAPAFAPTPEAVGHIVITGTQTYYQISFNHRFGFVRADDVAVSSTRPPRR